MEDIIEKCFLSIFMQVVWTLGKTQLGKKLISFDWEKASYWPLFTPANTLLRKNWEPLEPFLNSSFVLHWPINTDIFINEFTRFRSNPHIHHLLQSFQDIQSKTGTLDVPRQKKIFFSSNFQCSIADFKVTTVFLCICVIFFCWTVVASNSGDQQLFSRFSANSE